MKIINILIADDHPIFLRGLQEVIEMKENFKVCKAVEDGSKALQVAKSISLDVVILDIDMPHMNGLEVAEELRKFNPDLPVLLLTMHKEKEAFLKALEFGVSGYVLKENTTTDIIRAIESVLKGQPYISPEMSAFLMKKTSWPEQRNADSMIEMLTPSETRILEMIASYKTSREIADELFISEKTVFNHRMNISKKLNITGKNSLLRFAITNMTTKN
jgi:two-component system, NarL family, response regulator DegU